LPSPLVFDYGWRPALSLGEVAAQAMALIGLAALTVIALIRKQPLGFLGAWFFLILAPTSSVLPITTEVAAEHRMYLPLAAVVVLAVVGGYALGAKLIGAMTSSAVFRRRAGLVAGLVIVCAIAATLAERTRARGRDYWSDEGLWIDTVNKRPSNDRARVGYGIDLLSAQRFADAEHELRIAVGLNDLNAHAHMNLGAALCAQGKLDEGIAHLERALALDPARKETYGLLGEAYGGRGNSPLSLRYFSRALELMPDNPFVLRRVAWLLATSPQDDVRNSAKAVELAERAVRITGGVDLVSLDTLATAYAEEGRFTAAAAAARDALALAQTQRNEAEIAELQQHLALFQAGKKLRAR
jgi:tetratricopeptide (TPR) repeat protein